jgi:hypothetical protein
VDVQSPEDPYAPELWQALGHYLDSLGDGDMAVPGGRYACASLLQSRRLPFLATLSLGQINHVVQLGISQKKVLGYQAGAVVPYRYSLSMQKERCALEMRPSLGVAGLTEHATWDQLRSFLATALEGRGGQAGLALASLKSDFNTECGAELSETVLGYDKLSRLLEDPRVSDICSVRLHRNGYALFSRQPPRAPPGGRDSDGAAGRAVPVLAGRPRPDRLDDVALAEAVGEEQEFVMTPESCFFPPTSESDMAQWGHEFPPTPEPVTPQWTQARCVPSGQPLPTLFGRHRPPAGQDPKAAASADGCADGRIGA